MTVFFNLPSVPSLAMTVEERSTPFLSSVMVNFGGGGEDTSRSQKIERKRTKKNIENKLQSFANKSQVFSVDNRVRCANSIQPAKKKG